MNPIIEVSNLTITVQDKKVVDDISFSLFPGRMTALVGESGSGKSLTALSLLGLLPQAAVVESGDIKFSGESIFHLDSLRLRKIRGRRIAMVFQEPFTALNPVLRVGVQISEGLLAHNICGASAANEKVLSLLDKVQLYADTAAKYPHELSGGMRQRVLLAMALSCDPDVLIFDEPTTALDVSLQKGVLDLIRDLQKEKEFAGLFITHDFSVLKMVADEVCVMRRGMIVEKGSVENVLNDPRHEYTCRLISCIPRLGDKRERLPV